MDNAQCPAHSISPSSLLITLKNQKMFSFKNLLNGITLLTQHTQIHSIFNSQWRVLNVSSINSVRHRMAWNKIHSIFNSQWRVLKVSSINSVRHRMAWNKAATSSDKESDNSLLGTSSLVCWPAEAWHGVIILCESLLTLVGGDGVDEIITTERGNCSPPVFTSSWWLKPVWDSYSDLNSMSSSLTETSEGE
jgi:hypothetical protein